MLHELTDTIEYSIPDAIIEWLKTVNGLHTPHGDLFGIGAHRKKLDIKQVLSIYTNFQKNNWIPVASDGCGNYYLTSARPTADTMHPIFFVDTMESMNTPTYIVSSNIWSFTYFYFKQEELMDENFESKWPFDKDYVLKKDPDINKVSDLPKPWDT